MTHYREDIDNESAYEKYTRLIINRRFLSMAFGMSALTILFGVEGFSDLLIDDVLQVETNGYITLVSALLPAGIVTALLFTQWYQRKYSPSLHVESKYIRYTLIANVPVTILILTWIWYYYDNTPSNDTVALIFMGILFFIYGFLIAYPYYVPSGVFSLRYGGKDAGQVNALIDLFGFAFAAPFSYGGSWLSESVKEGWWWVWITMYILKEDPNIDFSNSQYGTLAVIAGLSYAFGKMVDGILIDGRFCFKFMNEVRSMIFFQLASSICVFFFTFGNDVTYFAIWAIPNAIVQAGTWPAFAKMIYTLLCFVLFCFILFFVLNFIHILIPLFSFPLA